MQFKKPSVDRKTIRHKITKLMNASTSQPRIIKLNLAVLTEIYCVCSTGNEEELFSE